MRVQLGRRLMAIDAPTVVSGPTRRPAAVIAWAANGRPFALTDSVGRSLWQGRAALVPPQFARGLRAIDCELISLNYEAGHPWYHPLAAAAEGQVRSLNPKELEPLSEEVRRLISEPQAADLESLATELAARLLANESHTPADDWLEAALQRLEDGERASLYHHTRRPDACGPVAGIGRALGLPLRSYLLWRRFRSALPALQAGADLTTIAHDVGFYDLPQMSRTFMTYFGYQPSRLKRREIIQIVS